MILPLHKNRPTTAQINRAKTVDPLVLIRIRNTTRHLMTGALCVSLFLANASADNAPTPASQSGSPNPANGQVTDATPTKTITKKADDKSSAVNSKSADQDSKQAASKKRIARLRRGNKMTKQNVWSKPKVIIDSRGTLPWVKPERIIIGKFHPKQPSFLNPTSRVRPISTDGEVEIDGTQVDKASHLVPLSAKKDVEIEPASATDEFNFEPDNGVGFLLNPPMNNEPQPRPNRKIARKPTRKPKLANKNRKPEFVALQPTAETTDDLGDLIEMEEDLLNDDLGNDLIDDTSDAEASNEATDVAQPETGFSQGDDPGLDLLDDQSNDLLDDSMQEGPADGTPVEDLPADDDLPSADDLGFGDETDATDSSDTNNDQSDTDDLGDDVDRGEPRIVAPEDEDPNNEVRTPEGSASDLDDSDVNAKTSEAEISVYNGRDCPEDLRLYEKSWNEFRRRPLTNISLDITPRFEPNQEPAEAAKLQAEKLGGSAERDWTNRSGRVVAFGKLEDFKDGKLFIRHNDRVSTVDYHTLSNEDVCFTNAWWGTPTEYRANGKPFEVRNWKMTTFTWKAAGVCHKPLYFEEVQLERYGHSAGPVKQTFLSGAHFFGSLFMLPYNMGLNPPNECQYELGYYRPGDCAPWLLHAFPLSARGARMQLGAIVGGITLIP